MSWRALALKPGRAAWSSFDEDITIVRFTFFAPRWTPFSHVASRAPRALLRTPPSSQQSPMRPAAAHLGCAEQEASSIVSVGFGVGFLVGSGVGILVGRRVGFDVGLVVGFLVG